LTTNYLIIHGTGGSPEGNWFPWLKLKLESQGSKVFCPQFPTPENHSFETWLSKFKEIKSELKGPTILIGHSLGCAFAFRLIELNLIQVKSCILVCPFISRLNLEYYDELNASFVDTEFNWDEIKQNCEYFYGFAGSNDPYVSLETSMCVAIKLGIELEIIENGGHLNSEFGFTEAEFLVQYVHHRN